MTKLNEIFNEYMKERGQNRISDGDEAWETGWKTGYLAALESSEVRRMEAALAQVDSEFTSGGGVLRNVGAYSEAQVRMVTDTALAAFRKMRADLDKESE